MKNKKNIAYKVLAIAGAFFIGKYIVDSIINYAYNRITYSFGRPTVEWRGLANFPPVVKVILPMTVINKNPIGVTIDRFVGELFYGNVKLSDVIIPSGGLLPANGQLILNLDINIQGVQVIQDIMNSISQTGTYTTLINVIKLKGNLETSLYRVPIETNLSLV